MVTHHGNSDNVDQQKFISLLKSFDALKHWKSQIVTVQLILKIYHFPSLVYVRLRTSGTGSLEYTITNCRQLKYLYYHKWNYDSLHHISLPSSSSCHLQQLYLRNVDLSAAIVRVLSAHGGLEQVILYNVTITTSAITTLISNSPNLILLYIIMQGLNHTVLNLKN